MGSGTTLRFDRFVLDCGDERLVGPHGPVHIGNKAFQVLCALVHQRGKLLTKETLFETVWDGTFVSESALTSVIKELRRALGDESKSPRFIDTVYGRGYRFIAGVEDVDTAEHAAAPEEAVVPKKAELVLPLKPSIAVLPFVAHGEVEDWFADGIVEEVTIALTRFSTLFVIAAASSLTLKAAQHDHPTISRMLGVRYLLEGSVRCSADRCRITVRLIDGIADKQVWADKYDESMEDVFALHDRVALAVAGRIGSSIDDAETRRLLSRPAQSRDVAVLYARANAKLRAMRPDSLTDAIALANEILTLEPDNAPAASLIAFCHALLVNMGWSNDVETDRARAVALCDRAMQTPGDDERVLGYCGAALHSLGVNLPLAVRLTERAIQINPGSATTLFWGGWMDSLNGRPERGLERLETSIRLNPLSEIRPLLLIPLGTCLLLLRRFDEAAAVLSESVQSAPLGGGLPGLTVALAHGGRLSEARAAYRRLVDAGGSLAGLGLLQDPEQAGLVRDGIAAAQAA